MGESFGVDDMVVVDLNGNGEGAFTGRVIGLATVDIIDLYIVEFVVPIPGYCDKTGKPWKAFSVPNTLMKKI